MCESLDADKLVKEGVHTTQFLGFFVADCYHFYFLLATSLCVVSIFQLNEETYNNLPHPVNIWHIKY